MKHIFKCEKCNTYTMQETCSCGGKAKTIKPQRYSPGKFAKYRKEAKRKILEQKGLL
ncbi:ribosome biogenesis protein [Candidatus Woesearchaeota archaeon]|nr:MAG: ribosome biogenesis protein [Candidatus Woesearchaeota archaeon ex4484_78]RLE46117.1 MAG: ribosome biogenesis protein [Candidatus Woesearchaeota archaeon]